MGPRRLLRLIRACTTTHTDTGWFCNLDNHRDPKQVAREVRAVLATGPAWLEMCETVGNVLPEVPGYHLIRSTANPSRANVAAYVRDDLPVTRVRWHQHTVTWPRTEGPGIHPARCTLEYRAAGIQRLVGHQPPKGALTVLAGQKEGVEIAARAMTPWKRKDYPRHRRIVERLRPRGIAWDSNRRWAEPGPGPKTLASAIRGEGWFKTRIDNWVTRHLTVTAESVVSIIPNGGTGVRFMGDHGYLIRARFTVPRVWVRPE
ncbi:hypothetical protein Pam4_10 [Pseudanabaena phage Pam4]|nr:hypothetical protein Pam4_10 [Pseudanabaena phage Pam4]